MSRQGSVPQQRGGKWSSSDSAALLCLFGTSLAALIACPHSKVEESFGLQATHDLYYHFLPDYSLSPTRWSDPLSEETYDHIRYPGVVPRSFVGPLAIATLARCVSATVGGLISITPLRVQFLSRFLLLLLNLSGWHRFSRAVASRKSKTMSTTTTTTTAGNQRTAVYLLLVTACQFHIPFYMSRMLPNTFAMVLVLHAYADWIQVNKEWVNPSETAPAAPAPTTSTIWRAAVGLVAATTVFRCDLLLVLFTIGLTWLVRQDLTIMRALRLGMLTGILCLMVIVPLDTYLWQSSHPMWAEGQVFYYNTVLGKSVNWGTSPWYWYWTSALPKALLLTAAFVPLAFFRILDWMGLLLEGKTPPPLSFLWHDSDRLSSYLIPILAFVGLYSCLGHKEVRFIFPALPIFNLCSATALSHIHSKVFSFAPPPEKEKVPPSASSMSRFFWIIVFIGSVLSLVASLAASALFLAVSHRNYPGGDALMILTDRLVSQVEATTTTMTPPQPTMTVFIDNAAAMTGVSLFGQRHAQEQLRMATTTTTTTIAPSVDLTYIKAGYEEENTILGGGGGGGGLVENNNNNNGDDNILSSFPQLTHALSERPLPGFTILDVAQGSPRMGFPPWRIRTEDSIYILQRDDWSGF